MTYKIRFKKSVGRDLKKIEKQQVERILSNIEDKLGNAPETYPSLTGKFSGLRKFRVGNYRIIYSILDDAVLILRISHRRESYR